MTGLDIDEMSEYLQTPRGKKKFKSVTSSMDSFSPLQKKQFLLKSLKLANSPQKLELIENAMRRLGYKETEIIGTKNIIESNTGFGF